MRTPSNLILTLVLFAIAGTACDVNNSDDSDKEEPSSAYTVALRAVGGQNEATDYILNTNDLMGGVITAEGIGIEQTGWRYITGNEHTLFSIGYYTDNNAIAYELDEEGNIVEKGRFVFENTLDVGGYPDPNTLLAMEVPRVDFADRVLHTIDTEEVSITGKTNLRIWESRTDSLVAWPTGLNVRNNKLFIPFYKLHARGDFSTPQTDTAYVAVYSYPDLEFEKYITDTRMGPIGIYGSSYGMIEDEDGNYYAYSSASLASGFTTQSKPSGILKINNGETEFDENYFFNVEEITGGKIHFFEYIGNGKAIANIVIDDSSLWGSYATDSEIHKMVIIDLENKTSTDIDGVPLHGGFYGNPWHIEGDKVYAGIVTSSNAFVYEIDANTATGVKGAEIIGEELKGIYKLEQ
ncbi:MAG: DUF4374 domain-containing protein [Balneolaceae bacterium]|nr:DUF4374 domain-containing protein [Balneolaceae bacterium]